MLGFKRKALVFIIQFFFPGFSHATFLSSSTNKATEQLKLLETKILQVLKTPMHLLLRPRTARIICKAAIDSLVKLKPPSTKIGQPKLSSDLKQTTEESEDKWYTHMKKHIERKDTSASVPYSVTR